MPQGFNCLPVTVRKGIPALAPSVYWYILSPSSETSEIALTRDGTLNRMGRCFEMVLRIFLFQVLAHMLSISLIAICWVRKDFSLRSDWQTFAVFTFH